LAKDDKTVKSVIIPQDLTSKKEDI
jgi:hypothetical protein